MNFTGLTEIDEKILNMLSGNARMSFVDIAKETGISSVAVRNHVQVLEERGIIEGYSVIVNPHKIETMLSVYIDLQADIGHLNAVAEKLSHEDCITQIYLLSGKGKLHVHGIFANDSSLEAFLREKLYPMEGVEKVDCQVILSRIKDDKGVRL